MVEKETWLLLRYFSNKCQSQGNLLVYLEINSFMFCVPDCLSWIFRENNSNNLWFADTLINAIMFDCANPWLLKLKTNAYKHKMGLYKTDKMETVLPINHSTSNLA